jgi:hypothetical protein
MWAGLKANVPVINGYSSGPPPNYIKFSYVADISELQRWIKDDFKGKLCLITPVKSEQQNNSVHYESLSVVFPLVQPNQDRP